MLTTGYWLGGRNGLEEPIPQPVDGLNVTWDFGIIVQRAPQAIDTGFEHGLGHHNPRPDGFKQHGFGYQLLDVFHQTLQDRVVLGSQGNAAIPPPETVVVQVQTDGFENP
jgi:hypothetical protein